MEEVLRLLFAATLLGIVAAVYFLPGALAIRDRSVAVDALDVAHAIVGLTVAGAFVHSVLLAL